MSDNSNAKNACERIADFDWVTTAVRPPSPNGRSCSLTLVDLFCSCGGLSLGVWEAARICNRRLDIRLAADISEEPMRVYRANFGDDVSRFRKDDVSRIFGGKRGSTCTTTESYWKGRIGKLDLLIAGPPCQGHSDLNNSTRRKDPRNGLYLRVARAAEVLNPKVVIIENVPAVQHDVGLAVPTTVGWLEDVHYRVSEGVIQLGRFGVPQLRKRHILVAIRDGDFSLSELDEVNHIPPTVGTYLSGLESSANSNGLMSRPSRMTERNKERVAYLFQHDLHDLPNEQRPACHRDKEHAYVSMYGRMHWDKPAQTLTSGFGSMGQGRYVHPTQQRLLTPHEAARLQGFPDFFDFTSAATLSGLREMIANAVPPQFTANLVTRLISKKFL